MTAYKNLQFQRAYQKLKYNNSSERKKCAVIKLEPVEKASSYRFVWIPGKLITPDHNKRKPSDFSNSIHTIKPSFGCSLSSRFSYSSIDLQSDYNDNKETSNYLPTSPIQYRGTIDDSSLQKNEFYTVVHIQFDKFIKNERQTHVSVEFKEIKILDTLQYTNNTKKIYLYAPQKVEYNDECSLDINNEPDLDSTFIEYVDLVDGHLTTNCIDMENTIEKDSIISQKDTSKTLTII